MELLKQGQFSPYPVEEQVISVWGGTTGKFDDEAKDAAAAAFEEVKKGFKTSDGKMLAGHEEFSPMADEDIAQAKIVRAKKG